MSDERTEDTTKTKGQSVQPEALAPELVEQIVRAAKKQMEEGERSPRELETREQEQSFDSFMPPQNLPDPTPEPGYEFRWVRTGAYGDADTTNVSMRFREGWTPVKLKDHPELMVICDHNSRWAEEGLVEVGGLLLCKMSSETADARKNYYNKLTERQHESVDNTFLKEEDPRAPMLPTERRSRTTFGRGSRV